MIRFIAWKFLFLFLISITNGTTLRVQGGNWGNVKTDEVQKVLDCTLHVFLPLSPALQKYEIVVGSTSESPKVLYERSSGGEYSIELTAKGRHWCQYVFQFSHELSHIMCGYKRGESSNLWFEESICEVASLYALQKIGKVWKERSSNKTWQSYAEEFQKYRRERIRNSSYPENFHLSSWWKKNRVVLSAHPHLRKENTWVAWSLYNLFAQRPSIAWSSCFWLNHTKSKQELSFEQYLQNWKTSCPEIAQKEFVEKIVTQFQF